MAGSSSPSCTSLSFRRHSLITFLPQSPPEELEGTQLEKINIFYYSGRSTAAIGTWVFFGPLTRTAYRTLQAGFCLLLVTGSEFVLAVSGSTDGRLGQVTFLTLAADADRLARILVRRTSPFEQDNTESKVCATPTPKEKKERGKRNFPAPFPSHTTRTPLQDLVGA